MSNILQEIKIKDNNIEDILDQLYKDYQKDSKIIDEIVEIIVKKIKEIGEKTNIMDTSNLTNSLSNLFKTKQNYSEVVFEISKLIEGIAKLENKINKNSSDNNTPTLSEEAREELMNYIESIGNKE